MWEDANELRRGNAGIWARAVAASVRMQTPCFTKLCIKLNGGGWSHSALRWGSGCRPSTHQTASRPRVAALTRMWPLLTSRCGLARPCQQHSTAPRCRRGYPVTRDLRRSRKWRSATRRRWRRRMRRKRRRLTLREMRRQSSGRRTRLRSRPSNWYDAAPTLAPSRVACSGVFLVSESVSCRD